MRGKSENMAAAAQEGIIVIEGKHHHQTMPKIRNMLSHAINAKYQSACARPAASALSSQ